MNAPTGPTAHVLVACDFSEASDEAIRQADAWARRCNAGLTAVHVAPNLLHTHPLFSQLGGPDTSDQLAIEKQAIEAMIAHVVKVTGRRPADFKAHVCIGAPDVTIVRYAESIGADLIAVGATGHSGLARLWLGSTAERVARLAHCSVLVARRGDPSGHLLAATDLSNPALPAVHAASAEAQLRDAKLHVLHAVEVGPTWYTSLGLPFGATPQPVTPDAVQSLRKLAEESLRALSDGMDADIVVADGPAPNAIVRTAETLPAELIVVATHGHTGLVRVALGSVAEKVVRSAPCSVLVVRA